MNFLPFYRASPNEIPLNLVDGASNFLGKLNVLRDMGRDTAKSGFYKHSSLGHVNHFGFPTSLPRLHIINDKLKITVGRLGIRGGHKYQKSKHQTKPI